MPAASPPPPSRPEQLAAPGGEALIPTIAQSPVPDLAAAAAIPVAAEFTRLGPYRVISKLGEGAMGAVYLGHDDEHDRRVAIKVLPRMFAGKPEMVSRFRREATAAGTLRHGAIIAAFRTGEDNGTHYYSMEYCAGESLSQLLERRGPFTFDALLPILLQVVSGLQYAHGQGFIHRDIKPSNLMVTAAGVAKILDLGLTKNIDDADASFNTLTGMAMGTPHYISPEQARGEKTIDGRADIYSLGATAYHLLSGQTPFEGSTAAVIMIQHLTREPPDLHRLLPDLPLGAVYLVRRMMAKNPAQRHADAAALRSDLELLISGKLPGGMIAAHAAKNRSNPRVQPAQQDKRARRTRSSGVMAAVAVACLVLVAGALLVVLMHPSPRAATTVHAPGLPGVLDHPAAGATQGERVVPISIPAAPLAATTATAPAPQVTPASAPHHAAPGEEPSAGQAGDAWAQSIQRLSAPDQVAAVSDRLSQLNPGFDGAIKVDSKDGVVIAMKLSSVHLSDITPIAALRGLRTLSCGGDWDHRTLTSLACLSGLHLESLNIGFTKVEDLTPLSGMPLTLLFAENARISDLAPLRGMPLEQLFLTGNPIPDLSPIQGMRLNHLHCGDLVRDLAPLSGMRLLGLAIWGSKVQDLAPIAGMALTDYLFMSDSAVSDLRPLSGASMHKLIFTPKNITAGIEVVRSMASLAEIGVAWDRYWPAAEFWRRYDAGEFGPPLLAQAPIAAPAPSPPAPPAAQPAPLPRPAVVRPPPASAPGQAILLQETFDAFNPAAPPIALAGRWKMHAGVSVVAEPGHGKVLKVIQRDTVSICGISFTVDPTLIAGRTVMITVAAKFPGSYTPVPGKEYARPRMNANGTSRTGENLWSLMWKYVEPNRPDWQLLTTSAKMPKELASLEVSLFTEVPAEVSFDNFGIVVTDTPVP